MKSIILISMLGLIGLYGSGCIGTGSIAANSGLNTQDLSTIPKGAKYVVCYGADAATLYNNIINVLMQRGHRIVREDKERFYIITEGKDVGQSTMQRMTITVTADGVATIKTEYMPGQDAVMAASALSGIKITPSWQEAQYIAGRSGIAFGESIVIAKMASERFEGRIN